MALIHEKLSTIQKEIEGILKDKRHQKGYMFRGIEDFLNTMHPLFKQHEIVILPSVVSAQDGTTTTSRGTTMLTASVVMSYKFIATDGSSETASASGFNSSSEGAQHANAQKDAYKTMLEATFSIPTVKQQVAQDNNGYTETLVKEEPTPTAPRVSEFNSDQIKNLTSLVSRMETPVEYVQMANWIESKYPKMLKDPVAQGIILDATKKILSTNSNAGDRARLLYESVNWYWASFILVAMADPALALPLDSIRHEMVEMKKRLGEIPEFITKLVKKNIK